MTDTIQHRVYSLPMNVKELVLIGVLLDLSSAMMRRDIPVIRDAAEKSKKLMRHITSEGFDVLADKVELLAKQAAENGEMIELQDHPLQDMIDLMKKIGMNVHVIDVDTMLSSTDGCCGHSDEGSETDPLCDHCGQRHP